MIRRPPRSTLFPYTTSSDLPSGFLNARKREKSMPDYKQLHWDSCIVSGTHRSEEHTSELQSQSNLVCRLLLEKKNKLPELRKSHHESRQCCDNARSQHSTRK